MIPLNAKKTAQGQSINKATACSVKEMLIKHDLLWFEHVKKVKKKEQSKLLL